MRTKWLPPSSAAAAAAFHRKHPDAPALLPLCRTPASRCRLARRGAPASQKPADASWRQLHVRPMGSFPALLCSARACSCLLVPAPPVLISLHCRICLIKLNCFMSVTTSIGHSTSAASAAQHQQRAQRCLPLWARPPPSSLLPRPVPASCSHGRQLLRVLPAAPLTPPPAAPPFGLRQWSSGARRPG